MSENEKENYDYNCVLCGDEIVCTVELKRINQVCDGCYEKHPYENPERFGKFIASLRDKYGWSRDYVAKHLGFNSESSIMNIETGHTVMKHRLVARFCMVAPKSDRLTPTVLHAMFIAESTEPPCKCPCHYDMGNAMPNVYDEDGRCRLCEHIDGDCQIIEGLWFER